MVRADSYPAAIMIGQENIILPANHHWAENIIR